MLSIAPVYTAAGARGEVLSAGSKMEFDYQISQLGEQPAEELLASDLGTLPLAMLGRLPPIICPCALTHRPPIPAARHSSHSSRLSRKRCGPPAWRPAPESRTPGRHAASPSTAGLDRPPGAAPPDASSARRCRLFPAPDAALAWPGSLTCPAPCWHSPASGSYRCPAGR